MKPSELFKLIRDTEYETAGKAVDYSIQVFIEEKKIRLLFEESNSFIDWINNLNILLKPYKFKDSVFWFAKGWCMAYESACDIIMKKLLDICNCFPSYIVEICGWSFGGAISLLAALDFYYKTNLKANVITFGTPKSLFGKKTKKIMMSCCASVIQYANLSDIVTYYKFFPGYTMLNRVNIGRFNFFDLFNIKKSHCGYDNADLYK